MRRVLLIALAIVLHARPAAAQDDPWLGPDKALHFSLSAAIAGGGYTLGAVIDDPRDRPLRLILGASLGVAAGVGKELLDVVADGDPSWRDLAWDGLGIATGLLLAYLVDRLVSDDGGLWSLLSARAPAPPRGCSPASP